MGVARLATLAAGLEAGGLAGNTPAAVVSAACTPSQRHLFCTLERLVSAVNAAGLSSPAIVVVGSVVQIAPEWALARSVSQAPASMRQAAF